jgi:hypothetical protein
MADFPGELFLDNDFLVRAGSATEPLMVESPTTGVVGAFTGQTLTAFLSASEDHDATTIHANTSITLTESGTVPGFYLGGFSGANHTAHTLAFVDLPLYLHVTDPSGIYHRVETVMVRSVRSGA